MLNQIQCIKSWFLDGYIVFREGKCYPIIDYYENGDRRIKGYKIKFNNNEIWFYSGNKYFNIDYLKECGQ